VAGPDGVVLSVGGRPAVSTTAAHVTSGGTAA